MRRFYTTVFLLLVFSACAIAQPCFNSGTGLDGSYSAAVNTTIAGGTYNFSSFNIDAGVTVTVTGTQPLIIYCTGVVTINGTLSANGGNGADGITYVSGGTGGIGVAGGANGGDGSFSSPSGPLVGIDGNGPGGANNHGAGWSGGGGGGYGTIGGASGGVGGFSGPVYGDANISALETGSGGGGGSGGYDCGAGGGGAGGGIIAIYTGTGVNIGVSGMISANGGNGGSDGTGNCGGGGGGSGGSIILASPSVTNNGVLSCTGGLGGGSAVPGSPYYGDGGTGGLGRIRIDYNGSIAGAGTSNPPANTNTPVPGIAIITASASPNDSVCSGQQVTLSGGGGVSYGWTGGVMDAVAFTPGGTMTYTVTGTDGNGCTNTNSITVTVLPTPTVGYTVSPNDSVCPGTPITLTGNGASNYSWSGGITNGQPFTPGSSTTYTVTGTSAEGCTNTATAPIVVNPLPNVTLGNDIVQPNPPALLDAGAGFASYLWNTSETTQTISVTSNGTYVVTVTNVEGCTDMDTIQVNFTAEITNPNGLETVIQLYPNPSSGSISLNIQNIEADMISIDIMDLTGKVAYHQWMGISGNELSKTFDLHHLSNGVYILRVSANGASHSLRFIISK